MFEGYLVFLIGSKFGEVMVPEDWLVISPPQGSVSRVPVLRVPGNDRAVFWPEIRFMVRLSVPRATNFITFGRIFVAMKFYLF